jgi:hypothetical protein
MSRGIFQRSRACQTGKEGEGKRTERRSLESPISTILDLDASFKWCTSETDGRLCGRSDEENSRI